MSVAIDEALRQARVAPIGIGYANAHGSGTKQNDRHETAALKRSLGDHAYRTPTSSIKSMVGHSLGGLLARGLATRRPDLVDSVVTLGSPLLAPGATHTLLLLDLTLLVRLQRVGLGVMGTDCTSGECARLSWDEARAPLAPGTPYTSVFSCRDGIVDWRSCLDPQARTVEVRSSHLGMAFDPDVLDVVAAALASDREQRAFSRPASPSAARPASAGRLPAASR